MHKDDALRWETKYEQILLEHEAYKRRVEEGTQASPTSQRRINLLEDKLQEANREIEMKAVELNVLNNKYNQLREDYANVSLKTIAADQRRDEIENAIRSQQEANSADYLQEIQDLQTLLRKQEEQHRQERMQWQVEH